jgi:hypothetical protein
MELKVLFSEDPAFVLRSADEFLSSEPVLHNLILSILHSRVAQGDPGRYWTAFHAEKTVGVVVQSPLEYPATLTHMEPRAVVSMVDAIAEGGLFHGMYLVKGLIAGSIAIRTRSSPLRIVESLQRELRGGSAT